MKRFTREIDGSTLEITPLGAGNEVGRSCVLLRFKGKSVLFDCGVHPTYGGISSLPFFDSIEDPSKIDAVCVTHFHLDHCAALPYFTERTSFRGRVYMTHPTTAMYRLVLSDFCKMSKDEQLYTEQDLAASMDKVERLNYHQEIDLGGIKISCYNAGHVLGAAMFLVEIAGVRVLYTGDFSRVEDRHLMGAEVPPSSVDVLIVEATYGVQVQQPREERERMFTGWVHDIVKRGGRCLIPVFALGRAQELLLILEEYWSLHSDLHGIPVWYASSLAQKCMTFYQTFSNMMNERIRQKFTVGNPFEFTHVKYLSLDDLDDRLPCVVMASPGMLQSGPSRELFERWCGDSRNGCVLPGYSVEGSFAKALLTGQPRRIKTMAGNDVPMNASVHYISFSAHSDYAQTSQFIDAVEPPYVILVHGEAKEMGRLKQALTERYQSKAVTVMMPKNCQAVQIEFRGESRIAKIVGELANEPPVPKRRLSGVLVRKNFNYRVVSPAEIPTYTQLKVARVQQKLRVPYHCSFEVLGYALSQLCGNVSGGGSDGSPLTIDGDRIVVTRISGDAVEVRWDASVVTDMVVDGVLSVVLALEMNPVMVQKTESKVAARGGASELERMAKRAAFVLQKHFGTASACEDGASVSVTVDDCVATVAIPSFTISCDGAAAREKLEFVVSALRECLLPVTGSLITRTAVPPKDEKST